MTEPTNAVLAERIEHVVSRLGEILTQTQKTNGRVTKLEKWQATVLGIVIGGNVSVGVIWAILNFFFK